MRAAHFDELRPVCPACRSPDGPASPLRVGSVAVEQAGDVEQGTLVCSDGSCRREYPVIDGIPILVPELRKYVADHIAAIEARDDLSPLVASLLADCAGPDSEFGWRRYYLSSYAQSQYGESGGMDALREAGFSMLSNPPAGRWLDIGCATGGAAFDLAARTDGLVLGIDIDFSLLRFARRLAMEGRATYARKQSGVVYDTHDVDLGEADRERVDFWACDAMALPFATGTFEGALGLNVIDSVRGPLNLLSEVGRVLRTGAEVVFASPYDWSPTVTELPFWIGGHSQRSETGGNPVRELRRLLSDESPPELSIDLRLVRDREGVPWRTWMHERATVDYQTHVVVARAN